MPTQLRRVTISILGSDGGVGQTLREHGYGSVDDIGGGPDSRYAIKNLQRSQYSLSYGTDVQTLDSDRRPVWYHLDAQTDDHPPRRVSARVRFEGQRVTDDTRTFITHS